MQGGRLRSKRNQGAHFSQFIDFAQASQIRGQVCHLDTHARPLINLNTGKWSIWRIEIYQKVGSDVQMTDLTPNFQQQKSRPEAAFALLGSEDYS